MWYDFARGAAPLGVDLESSSEWKTLGLGMNQVGVAWRWF
jgi:hypothetical protein